VSGEVVSVKPPRLMAVGSQPVAPWQPPSMDPAYADPISAEVGEAQVRVVEEDVASPPALPTAEEIEAIQREAWEEGYRAGHAEGLAAGQAEIDALASRWQGLVNALAKPLDAADGNLESALLELALALTRQLVRRELKTQPDEIIPVVREALGGAAFRRAGHCRAPASRGRGPGHQRASCARLGLAHRRGWGDRARRLRGHQQHLAGGCQPGATDRAADGRCAG